MGMFQDFYMTGSLSVLLVWANATVFSLSFQRASFFLPQANKNRRQKKTYIVSTACGKLRMSVYSDLMRAKSIG
ncbi:hypothetical protein [Bacillus paralicheniformis]|uniref:hypothetical protein n=1 Tax=Bacillus paralicheniformis TaxID=1648923 RepID=UPI0011551FD6|nr:hypothetical protein [Bacillus paralicheniformis]